MATIEIDQRINIPISEYRTKKAKIRYTYKRKLEAKDNGDLRGQDYLVFRTEEKRIIFVLCDGVASSFFGDLGSQIVGETLLHWLCNYFGNKNGEYLDSESMLVDLTNALNNTKNLGQKITGQKRINSSNTFTKNVIEERRTIHGTQSNFVSGIIEYPDNNQIDGSIHLFWLGDAKIKIFKNSQNISGLLKAKWDSNEAWSSVHGVVGKIHHYSCPFTDVDSIIAHSDGANPIEERLLPTNSSNFLVKLLDRAQHVKDDDVSYLDIILNKNFRHDRNELTYGLRKHYDSLRLRRYKKNQLTKEELIPKVKKLLTINRNYLLENANGIKYIKYTFFFILIFAVINMIFLGFIISLNNNISELSGKLKDPEHKIVTTAIYEPLINVDVTLIAPTSAQQLTATLKTTPSPDNNDQTIISPVPETYTVTPTHYEE